jgi:hypothetical protein
MIAITEYDESTGELGFIKSFSDEETYELNSANPHVMGAFSSQDYYVVEGEAVERPASPVTIDGRTLSDVPSGSTLWIDGESYEAEGDVELDFVMPGTYKLRVVCFPYLDWEYDLVML